MTYCVDLRSKVTGDSLTTMLKTDSLDKAWEFANKYNETYGITVHECALLDQGETEGWTPHPYWASVYEGEEISTTEDEEDNTMDYQKQIEKAVQEFYDATKAFATSRHYTLSYWWVESNFGLDLSDKQVQADVNEMSYNNGFEDKIQCLDFDDIKKEVTIMIWEKGEGKANGDMEMKKYTLENYKEFCDEALVCPPFEDEDGWQKWIDEHKIQIIANNCIMELDYDADTVNELDFSLREIHEAILGSGEATTGNTVGSQYHNATWKDILRLNVLRMLDERTDLKTAIQRTIKYFDADAFKKCMMEIEAHPEYIEEHEVNYNTLSVTANSLSKIFDATERQNAFKEMLCQKIEIEELIDHKGMHSDKVVIMDCSILPFGHFVGWHYGVEFDKDAEDNQYYITKYIEEMVK